MIKRLLALLLLIMSLCMAAHGQATRRTSSHVGRPAAAHNFLTDSLAVNEFVDSMANRQPKVVPNVYPLLFALEGGLDLLPAAQRALGYDYGIGAATIALNLHNRYIPTLEAGLFNAKYHPEEGNFTYKVPVSPYFKLGLDYNFLYNSDPAYRLTALVRYGFSRFTYQYTNVDLNSAYWGENQTIDYAKQTYSAGYLDLGASLLVKLVGRLSLGWSVRYQWLLHHSAAPQGAPCIIPGMNTGAVNASINLVYTLPLAKSSTIETPQ